MRRLLLPLLAMFVQALAAQTSSDWTSSLPAHPRLLVTDADLARAKAAAASDPLRKRLDARIIAHAVETLKASPLRHRLIGPRLLDQSRDAIDRIATCAMAYRLTGDERFAQRALYDLHTVCAFPDWNPSHFLDVAEMGTAVGIGYDWLYGHLTPEDRALIRASLKQKALAFAPAAYAPLPHGAKRDKRVFWVDRDMNWNQVCNAGLLTAALAMAEDEPALAQFVVQGVRGSLPLVMARYQPDGGYPEGPGYWSYGTTYNAIALSELQAIVGTDFGLSGMPDFNKTTLYRLGVQSPNGMMFNYADAHEGDEANPTLGWAARRFGPPLAVAQSRKLLESELSARRVGDRFLTLAEAWLPEAPRTLAPLPPLDMHFRGAADIVLMRGSWDDPNALFVGLKAGDNTANHSHLDLGSFILDSDGQRWAESLGPDDYNLPGYFGKERWSYYRLNNRSKNTVRPDDLLQDPDSVAPITAFSSHPDDAEATADLTALYPNRFASLTRTIALLERSRVLITDTAQSPNGVRSLHWGMMTHASIQIGPNGRTAELSLHGKRLRAEIVSPAPTTFRIESTRPANPAENPNTGTSMLAVDAPLAPDSTVLSVLLIPIGPNWPAPPAQR